MGIFDCDLWGRTKHDLAIQRIRSFCSGKRVLLAFSGGKDSQCCYHLCKEAGVDFVAQYSITRFEPPELIRFIRSNYSDVVFRRAYKMSLVDEIAFHGLPTRWMRWCCTSKHVKTVGYDISVIGVRAEESPRRKATWRLFGYKPDHTAYICPIIDWTAADVWEYLGYLKVPHCCLYDKGFTRIGCVCCPLSTLQNRQRDIAWWPKTVAMLRLGADKFVARMRDMGFVTARGKKCPLWSEADNPEDEYWNRWISTGQTSVAIGETPQDRNAPEQGCLFEGSGFSESDNPDTDI